MEECRVEGAIAGTAVLIRTLQYCSRQTTESTRGGVLSRSFGRMR